MFITDLLSPHQLLGHPENTLDENPQGQLHTSSLLVQFSTSCSTSPGHPMLTPMLFKVSNISPIETQPQWKYPMLWTFHLAPNLSNLHLAFVATPPGGTMSLRL